MKEVIAQKEETSKEPAKKPGGPMAFRIDRLSLKIGKIVSKDLSKTPRPSVEAYDLGMQESQYENVTSAAQVMTLMLTESLKHAAIHQALIYGAASVVGVSVLPASIVVLAIRNDTAEDVVNAWYGPAYDASLKTLRELGEVNDEDKKGGTIKANVQGSDVTVTVSRSGKTRISVSARHFFMPNQKVAAGVLYMILERLK